MGRTELGEVMIPFIRVHYSTTNSYDFRIVWRAIQDHAKRPDREQARALLEQPVHTDNLTIYRDEETNE